MAGGALIFVQVICGLISLLEPATASLELGVAYPIISNRSVVELSCREGVFRVDGAKFRRNNTVIITNNGLVSVVSEGTGTITFSFTQQQEGVFTCTDQTSTSNAIALAAAPSVDYSNEQRDRYIILPSLDSQRNVTLHCDIQPGLLSDRYRVEWTKESATEDLTIITSDGHYNLTTAVVTSKSHEVYRCTVHIQHRSDDDTETAYVGPRININKIGIRKHVRNETVTPEDSVSFICSFFHDSVDRLNIEWAVDGSNDTLCKECFIGIRGTGSPGTLTGTLTINGNSSLSIGTHDVKCTASNGDIMLTSSAVLTIQEAELQLIVNYPNASNRSFVKLTCSPNANSNSQVNGVKFERDNELITSDNGLVHIIQSDNSMISFFFTQDQEGWFRCTTSDDISSAIALAAAPANYANEEKHRYIAFLHSNRESPRNTNLSCDIRPGKLEQFYTVEWVNISDSGTVNDLPNIETYDFPIDIEFSDNDRYRCIVIIQHRSDRSETIAYDGRNIIINKEDIVLPQIKQHIDDKNITQGDHVKFFCSFSRNNEILNIFWTVGTKTFSLCDFSRQDTVDKCHTISDTANTKTSTFAIQDTSSLAVGEHLVNCTAVSLNESFTSDLSYIRDMFEVANTAILTIARGDAEGTGPGIIGGSVAAGIFVVLLFATAIIFSYILKKRLFHTKRKAVIEIQRSQFLMKEFERQKKLQKYVIPQKSIRILNIIGEGEFGIVYRAHLVKNSLRSVTTLPVAVKMMKGFSDREKPDNLFKEALQMHDLDHRNVMSLVGVYFIKSDPCIVMPYMENGSLLTHLKKERQNLIVSETASEQVQQISKTLLGWSLQVAEGMQYLTSKRIVHKDLAARNCMLGENMIVKVADFGFSENMYSRVYVRIVVDGGVRLPVKWMAPESILDGVFSEKSDVWSFGVTCWEIFTGGVTPYPGVPSSAIPRMRDEERWLDKPDNEACSDEMYDMMVGCWDGEPAHRPSFSDLVTDITSQLNSVAGGYVKIITV